LKYSKKRLILYVFLFCLSIMTWINSKSFSVVDLFIFSLGAQHIDFNRIMRYFLITSIVTVFAITMLSQLGFIDNLIFIRGNRLRQSLGFYYPTNYVAIIFYISTCLLYYSSRNGFLQKSKHYLFFIAGIATYILCDSRLGSLCILLLIPLS